MGLKTTILGDTMFFTDGQNLFQPEVRLLVVIVGKACNFKCKDCGNLVPYMPKELQRYDVEPIMKNIAIILKSLTCVSTLQIQGGEPFIYSDLERLLDFVGQFEKVKKLSIATNGSIVPSNKLMETLKRNKVSVRISNYGLCPKKTLELEKKCERFGVDRCTYDFATKTAMWYDEGGINNFTTPPHMRTQDSLDEAFNTCKFRSCLTLDNGDLTHCSRSSRSYVVQGFERVPDDFVHVEDTLRFQMKFWQYILAPQPMTACRYCNGTRDSMMIPPAVQLDKDFKLNNINKG